MPLRQPELNFARENGQAEDRIILTMPPPSPTFFFCSTNSAGFILSQQADRHFLKWASHSPAWTGRRRGGPRGFKYSHLFLLSIFPYRTLNHNLFRVIFLDAAIIVFSSPSCVTVIYTSPLFRFYFACGGEFIFVRTSFRCVHEGYNVNIVRSGPHAHTRGLQHIRFFPLTFFSPTPALGSYGHAHIPSLRHRTQHTL